MSLVRALQVQVDMVKSYFFFKIASNPSFVRSLPFTSRLNCSKSCPLRRQRDVFLALSIFGVESFSAAAGIPLLLRSVLQPLIRVFGLFCNGNRAGSKAREDVLGSPIRPASFSGQ